MGLVGLVGLGAGYGFAVPTLVWNALGRRQLSHVERILEECLYLDGVGTFALECSGYESGMELGQNGTQLGVARSGSDSEVELNQVAESFVS